MKVKLIEKEITEWVKKIQVEREDKLYYVDLRWDTHNGYEILAFWHNLKRIKTPKWADVAEFEYDLDSATEEEVNA